MRYDDCVSFVVDVPDELSEYTIPKLTFQPIVENAWLHGIMDKEEKSGNILLTGWRQGGDIVFLISDDHRILPPLARSIPTTLAMLRVRAGAPLSPLSIPPSRFGQGALVAGKSSGEAATPSISFSPSSSPD